ncbi:MAG: bifunctional glutamate N-acetyltransferase/amino-acid acetyltransferase ArgJ [Schwartzia sp. (in: firmicutes)]
MFSDEAIKKSVTFPKGFTASGIKAGIKKSGNDDLALIYSERPAAVAGTFTQNQVAAAPVEVSKEVVRHGTARAIVANAGCANACTGDGGLADAKEMGALAGAALGCAAEEVVVASTGVIGVRLPMEKLRAGIKEAAACLSLEGSAAAAKAILTTDTYCKGGAVEIELGGQKVRFGAIAKGSGMIQPNMATMLAFITTDAAIEPALLQAALSEVVEVTFNMISVDGDMSTNDMAIVMANGAAGNPCIAVKGADYDLFVATLRTLCTGLSQRIAADGEGATKFLTIEVTGAHTFADAKQVAMSVAKSPLVKTAFFGEDPNWGRVICAVGYAGVPMVPEKTVVKFGDIPVYAHGVGAAFDRAALDKVMEAHDIAIAIDLGIGEASATVWSCDFSYGYVKINGEYHT